MTAPALSAPRAQADLRQLERRRSLADPIQAYQRMVEIRCCENAVQNLYEEGHLRGSTHLCTGQEAVVVGIARSLRPSDTVACTYRGHGMALALGMEPFSLFAELTGRELGCTEGLGGSMHLSAPAVGLFPTSAIVGAGLPIAAGAALAAQVRGTDDIAVAVFGDGAANIGAFHETLNLASIWKLPVVFVCENNLYGEYTRIQLSTPIEDLARRADAYAIPGNVVDGQDLDAVAYAVADAALHARSGGGPALLEMKTYRFSGHSRSDQATYRPPGELDAWKKRDPIDIMANRLTSQGTVSASDLEAVRRRTEAEVEEAVRVALESPQPRVAAMFKHVYASPS